MRTDLDELKDEEFSDKVAADEAEAKEAFFADSDNVNEAAYQDMKMEDFWEASKKDYIENYFAK